MIAVAVMAVATAVSAGATAELNRIELEQAWELLLEAAVAGDDVARKEVERARLEGEHESIRKLAELLLIEWHLDRSDYRFRTPRLVWLPAIDFEKLPPYAHEVSAPAVVVTGCVSQTGRFEEVDLVKSSGSALIDQAALDNAARAVFRPARPEGSYTRSRAAITVHVDPQ